MEKELGRDEDTAVSNSGSGSGTTDLSGLENETDDLGRRILQHERETRRAKVEARPPFWRARPRPNSWAIDQLSDGKEDATETGRPGHRRTASAGNAGTDPPLNVPREWGKRSRRRTSWLQRYESEGGTQTGESEAPSEPPQVDEDSIITRRTVYTGDSWAAGTDALRHAIETTPPSMRRLQRHASSPSSMQHMNTTLPSMDTDDDFSAASLLASTPALNQRHRKVDELVKREIETVEKRGVTRRTLNQISEKFSNESLRPSTAPALETSRIPRRRSATGNKENEPFRAKEPQLRGSDKQSGLIDGTRQAVNLRNPQKPSHGRNDSMSLLKRLARVSSQSPSPAKQEPNDDDLAIRRASDPVGGLLPNGLDHGLSAVQPMSKKLKVEFDLPQPPSQTDRTSSKPPLAPESKNAVERKPAISNAKSALQDVVRDAKTGLDNQLGDSTIASLENLMDPTPDSSDFPRAPVHEPSTPPPRPPKPHTTDRQPKPPPSADAMLDILTQGLHATEATIRDANRGLQMVEDHLGNRRLAHVSTEPPPPELHAVPYTDHNGRTVCEHCGGGYTSVWRALWTEFRENFYTWDARTQYRLRLTWLGATCLVWALWYTLESVLCAYHCHPRYAVSMLGYGVDPYAPAFPFVLPTLLFRPFKAAWQPLGVFVAWLVGSAVHALFGGGAPRGRERTSSGATSGVPRESGAFGAQAAKLVPKAEMHASQLARELGRGRGWMAAASVATSATSRRVVESTMEAVDRFARMWEDGIAPS